jgi:hypothetical protein
MEPNTLPQGFAEWEKNVAVVYDKQSVGTGTVAETSTQLSVQGHYELGMAIAIVAFDFSVSLRPDKTCTVQANWPGLLEPNPIGPIEGTYVWVYVLARPSLLVRTNGYQINLTYTGPMGQPEITTGFTINITESQSEQFAELGFVYE